MGAGQHVLTSQTRPMNRRKSKVAHSNTCGGQAGRLKGGTGHQGGQLRGLGHSAGLQAELPHICSNFLRKRNYLNFYKVSLIFNIAFRIRCKNTVQDKYDWSWGSRKPACSRLRPPWKQVLRRMSRLREEPVWRRLSNPSSLMGAEMRRAGKVFYLSA